MGGNFVLNVIKSEIARNIQKNNTFDRKVIIEELKEYLSDLGLQIDDQIMSFINSELDKYTISNSFSESNLSTIPINNTYWLLPEHLDERGEYWKAYKKNIKKYLNLSDSEVENLKKEGLDIVNRLPTSCGYDESSEDYYIKKGLVYGHVQSGKTASMGAVISQYASFACKFVIILSGIHNNLWEQTQNRLRRDLDIDNQGNGKLSWKLITAVSDSIMPNTTSLYSDYMGGRRDSVIIGVFKKNSSVLEKLITNYLKVGQDLDQSFLKDFNVLIIDDECDQAGIDVSKAEQEERSRINALIVKLFNFFPRFAYIGYTATPFANVLNEAPSRESMYPADFITMLGEKKAYFGATKVFGLGEEFQTYKEYEDPVLDCVELFIPSSKKDIDDSTLRNALIYFAAATAVRRLRALHLNDERLLKQHATMMIHTSGKINKHREMLSRTQKLLSDIKGVMHQDSFKNELERVWKDIYASKREENMKSIEILFDTPVDNLYVPPFDVIYKETISVINKIEFRIDNSAADVSDRLYYDDSNEKTDIYVAIGGNTLSRGITIEGLIVAVFSRSVKTYDTLMQMGRWFGYRRNYEDLVRLWMTDETLKKMRFLAGVELDLQDTIERYAEETPRSLAMAIRTTPHMQIVRKLAMKGAEKASINYVGRHPQTIQFKNDKKWLEENIEATRRLLKENSYCLKDDMCNSYYLFEDVRKETITDFLNEYNFYENTNGLNSRLLTEFKMKAEQEGYINSWNIVVQTLEHSKFTDSNLIPGKTVNLLNRGKLDAGEDPNRLYLKAVTSPEDVVCDIPGYPALVQNMKNSDKFKMRNEYFAKQGKKTPGLLVVYPMAKDGIPRSKDRKPLNACADVYGISLFFPSMSKFNGKLYDSVSIRLKDEDIRSTTEYYDED